IRDATVTGVQTCALPICLRHQDIHKIVDVFNKQIELPKYSRMVSVAEIAANDYNLNIPRYIDSTEAEDLHDIEAHLLGGIPNYRSEERRVGKKHKMRLMA